MTNPHHFTVAQTEEIRRRQRGRARVMALGLLALVVLFYLITIAKVGLVG